MRLFPHAKWLGEFISLGGSTWPRSPCINLPISSTHTFPSAQPSPAWNKYAFFFFFFFFFFRTAPVAYGSSWARDQIRAAAASPHHSSRQCWIPSPLNEARDQTCIARDTSWVCNPLCHNGNCPKQIFYSPDLFSQGLILCKVSPTPWAMLRVETPSASTFLQRRKY